MRPVRFFFTYYKPQDKWTLIEFEFSTDFVDELDQSSKFFYIQRQQKKSFYCIYVCK